MSLRITAATDVGCRHDVNEDFYRAGRLSDGSCWVVLCDGMGGVDGGGRASELAACMLQNMLVQKLPELSDTAEIKSFLLDAADRANTEVYEQAKNDKTVRTMGTTLVMAVIRNNLAQIVHSGDSRAYAVTKNSIKRLTRDHSIVQELLDSGRITDEQAQNHPNKNIITSAIGVDVSTKIDYDEFKLARGDFFMVCTDGLSNMITDDRMAEMIRTADFYDTAQTLVRSAVDAGGYDNITAVVIEV